MTQLDKEVTVPLDLLLWFTNRCFYTCNKCSNFATHAVNADAVVHNVVFGAIDRWPPEFRCDDCKDLPHANHEDMRRHFVKQHWEELSVAKYARQAQKVLKGEGV